MSGQVTRVGSPYLCDFCNSPHPVTSYPTPSMLGIDPNGRERVVFEQGTWAACCACQPFVEARDAEGLTERVVQAFAATRSAQVRTLLRDNLNALYAKLLASRGESVPIGSWPEWVT